MVDYLVNLFVHEVEPKAYMFTKEYFDRRKTNICQK